MEPELYRLHFHFFVYVIKTNNQYTVHVGKYFLLYLLHDFSLTKRELVMLFFSIINALIKKWTKAVSSQSMTMSLVQQENQAIRLAVKHKSQKNTDDCCPQICCEEP